MKWICKAFRHNRSVQIVIPKKVVEEMGWGFNTHFVITIVSDEQIVIQSLDSWGKKQEKEE